MRPNEYHFSALMTGYARSGHIESAIGVMHSAIQSGVKANVVMFTIIIVGFARQGKPDKAIQTFQEMISAQVAPDVPAIDAVASSFFSIGAYATARLTLITLWPYIQPFPEEFRALSLHDLAIRFRALHGTDPVRLSKERKIRIYKTLASVKKNWTRQGSDPE
jgi:pentatricopeptide repeat protein